jgi:hypothetical protein
VQTFMLISQPFSSLYNVNHHKTEQTCFWKGLEWCFFDWRLQMRLCHCPEDRHPTRERPGLLHSFRLQLGCLIIWWKKYNCSRTLSYPQMM